MDLKHIFTIPNNNKKILAKFLPIIVFVKKIVSTQPNALRDVIYGRPLPSPYWNNCVIRRTQTTILCLNFNWLYHHYIVLYHAAKKYNTHLKSKLLCIELCRHNFFVSEKCFGISSHENRNFFYILHFLQIDQPISVQLYLPCVLKILNFNEFCYSVWFA